LRSIAARPPADKAARGEVRAGRQKTPVTQLGCNRENPFGDRVEARPYAWNEPEKLADALRGAGRWSARKARRLHQGQERKSAK
jgi:hypothetical protein